MADDSQILIEKPNSRMKQIGLLILLGVALLTAGGTAGYFLFAPKNSASETNPASRDVVAPAGPAMYISLAEPFIFNVTGDARDRLVQIDVQLMVRGSRNEAMAKRHLPLLRSTLLASFSAASVEQLRGPNGRGDLRDNALQALQATMEQVSGEGVIERVLFTSFVMQ
ncbi:flagellar basal body-associated FliL family protein [Thaumasiovibrio sp. DFM-14]|uniref:flagellar basal body-associated FliL family protein n=1 Tax=Thaumasiovibrio sp. DFM-14 TaxID=3384792 RepID=UPI00399FC707